MRTPTSLHTQAESSELSQFSPEAPQQRQSFLLDLMRLATSSPRLEDSFGPVSSLIAGLVPHDRLSACLRQDEEDYLEIYVLSAPGEGSPPVLGQGARLPLRTSPSGRAFLLDKTDRRLFQDEAEFPIDLILAGAGYRSGMLVPLRIGGRTIGTLNFAKREALRYSDAEVELAQVIADHLASPIEHAFFRRRLLRQTEELTFLNDLSTSVYEAGNVHELLEGAHERLRALTDMEGGVVLLLDDERQELTPIYDRNMPTEAIGWLRDHPVPRGKYIPGQAVDRCQILVIEDADHDPDELPPLRAFGVKTHLCIPMVVGSRALGVIGLIDRRARSFSRGEIALFATAGKQLGLALERVSLIERQSKLLERQQLLNELMHVAVSSLDVRDVFDLMAEKVRRVISFDWFYIALPVPGEKSFALYAFSRSFELPPSLKAHIPLEHGPSGEVIKDGAAIIVDDLLAAARYPRAVEMAKETHLRAGMFLPLVSKGRVFGSLSFFHSEPSHFTQRDLQVAEEIADHVAVVIEHALLSEESKEVAKLQERARLANEIHDSLAQAFIGVILELDLAEKLLSTNPEGVREELGRARQMAKEGLDDSRRSVLALRPSSLENSSLGDAIIREVNRLGQEGRFVDAKVSGSPFTLSEAVEADVFRITQEICANIRKHSGASRVEAAVTYEGRAFRLAISDNGAGFDVGAPGGGFGLKTMADRARRAGGDLAVDSVKGLGTRVTLRVPREQPQSTTDVARKIRVLLADDHAVARQGIRRMLESEPDIDVVGEADDGEEALRKTLSLKPDVVIADVRMPRMSGVELADTLTARGLASRTVILTAHLDGELIARAMRAGAQGYLLKDVVSTELAQAIRAVQRGDTYLQAAAASELARRVRDAGDGDIVERLTQRELEVLWPVVRGLRNKEIARELGITEATVKFHVAHIFEKLGVSSRAEAVSRALKLGVFDSHTASNGG